MKRAREGTRRFCHRCSLEIIGEKLVKISSQLYECHACRKESEAVRWVKPQGDTVVSYADAQMVGSYRFVKWRGLWLGLMTTLAQYEEVLRATQGDGRLRYALLDKQPSGQLRRPMELCNLDGFVPQLSPKKVKQYKKIMLCQAAKKHGQQVADAISQGRHLVGANLLSKAEAMLAAA